MNDAPAPARLSEREAIATLRAVAALCGGFVIRVYGGGRSPPLRVRTVRGFAVMQPSRDGMAWDSRPTWLYSIGQGLLLWAAPNVLKGNAAYATWRGIDDPEAEP
jgi:hypothetical protein